MKNRIQSIFGIAAKILLVASFVPYVIVTIVTIFGAFNGKAEYTWIISYYVTTLYGWESVHTLGTYILWFLTIPCVVYQIIYVIVMRLTSNKRIFRKAGIIALITVAAIFSVVMITVSIAEKRAKNKRYELISTGMNATNSYLIEKFGEENFNKMRIIHSKVGNGDIFDINRQPPIYYTVEKNPLSNNTFEIVLNANGDIGDSAMEVAIAERNLDEKFRKKYIKSLRLSPNVEPNIGYFSIDADKLYDIDYTDEELLDKMTFKFYSWFITMEQYNEEKAIDIIKSLYMNYHEEIMKYNIYSQVCFNIRIRTNPFDTDPYEWWVSGHYFVKDNYIEITFEPYVYEEKNGGKTIDGFTETYTLE